MPRRDPGGDTWRCNNPACRAWTWVSTSRERCFACDAPAPRSARTQQGHLLADVDPGHRDMRGFVPPGAAAAAADVRAAPPRAAQPAPLFAAPRPGGRLPAAPAGPLPTPPPPPARGQPRGRTGAGAATYARNPNRDFRGIVREMAAGDYREGGRAAVAMAPPPGDPSRNSPRRSQPPGDWAPFAGTANTLGGSGRGASPGRRAHSRGAAAGFRFHGPDHGYPPLRSATECWVAQEGKKVRLGMPACLAKPTPPTFLRLLRLLSARLPSRRPSGWSGTVSRPMPLPLRGGRPPPPVPLLLGRLSPRGLAREPPIPPTPRAGSAPADGSAGAGAPPPLRGALRGQGCSPQERFLRTSRGSHCQHRRRSPQGS